MRFLPNIQQSPVRFQRISRRVNTVMIALLGIAFISLILQYGFYFTEPWTNVFQTIDLSVLLIFILQQIAKILLSPNRRSYLAERWMEYILTLFFVAAIAIYPLTADLYHDIAPSWWFENLSSLYIIIAQIIILLDIVLGTVRYSRRVSTLHIQPARLFIGSFVTVILLGTLALLLPRATMAGISVVDALFTSTSAVCVTGLIVVDTGSAFTPLGQIIILFLIQIGGLGLMTFTTFFTLFSSRLSIKERVLMQQFLNRESLGQVRNTLRSIVLVTLFIEAIGAVLLYFSWGDVVFASERAKVFSSIFHSVSSFCNAGFSLFSENLAVSGAAMNIRLNLIVASLIILGGLGFITIVNIAQLRPWGNPVHRLRRRLTAHSRLVLSTSAILIAVGAVMFYVLEYHNVSAGLAPGEKILAALFQSITTRTAGFNTVDISAMAVPATLIFILLMFIGASPGSTGGGIKTTTAALVFLSAVNHVRGKQTVEIAHRRVLHASIERAYAALLFGLALVIMSIFLMTLFEPFPLLDIVFECFSAAATVGLSRGITFDLTDASKIVIIFTMLIGRVGTLTMMMALTRRAPVSNHDYPSEQIIVA